MQRRRDIRKQAGRLSAGQINRRRFVMSALATGVTMPTAMSLASKAEALVPRRGGDLRIAMHAGADHDALLEFATGNTLTEVSGSGEIVGDIADGVAHDGPGLVWTFDLRRDVTFSDGTPLTAAHIVDTFSGSLHPALANVTGMDATSDHQLVVSLRNPDLTFAKRLTAPGLTIRHLTEDGDTIGTGGYVVEHTTSGALTLRRRSEYWKAERAHFDTVTLSLAGSQAALQTEVMAGQVDYAAGIAPETVAFLAHLPNVELATFPATRALILYPSASAVPRRAHEAIAMLRAEVDRQTFIDRALLGHGRIGNDTSDVPATHSPESLPPPMRRAALAGPLFVSQPASETWVPHLVDLAKRVGVPLEAALSSGPEALLSARSMDQLGFACDALSACSDLFVPAWANDLAAHSTRLGRPAKLSPNLPNDGHRMIERWWFA